MRNLFESIHTLSKKVMKNSQIARTLKMHQLHRGEVSGPQGPNQKTSHYMKKVSAEGQCHRTLRRLHPQTLVRRLPQPRSGRRWLPKVTLVLTRTSYV